MLYEKFGLVPPKTDLVERVKLIRGEIKLSSIYPVDELRVNNNRIIEKKILEALTEGKNYIKGLGRLTSLNNQCVKNALIRLNKMGLVKCDNKTVELKKYYQLTHWGLNKLNRAKTIEKHLREEFHLAV